MRKINPKLFSNKTLLFRFLYDSLIRGRAPLRLIESIDQRHIAILQTYFDPLIRRIAELEYDVGRCHKKLASIHAICENDSSVED